MKSRHNSVSSSAQPALKRLHRSSSAVSTQDPQELEVLEDHQWRNILGSIHNKMLFHINAKIIRNTLLTRKIDIDV